MPTWDPKDPADTADYVLDWTELLNGDTIASFDAVTIAPSTSPALDLAGSPSQSFTDTATTIWLTGGIAGLSYTIDQTITTAGGRIYQRAAILAVEDTVPVVTKPTLVSLVTAKAHARLIGTDEDNDLQLKLDQAHALVVDYVNQRRSDDVAWAATVAAWTPETVPAQVQAAILLQFSELVRFRGDDPPATGDGSLSPTVRAYLGRLRDPAVA